MKIWLAFEPLDMRPAHGGVRARPSRTSRIAAAEGLDAEASYPRSHVDRDRIAARVGALTRRNRAVGAARTDRSAVDGMIGLPSGTRVWTAAGVADMRKGMGGRAAMVQTALGERPFSGDVFVLRGKRDDLVKLVWSSGEDVNLHAKRLDRGLFVWPQGASGEVRLSPAQLSMPREGIEWRHPQRT